MCPWSHGILKVVWGRISLWEVAGHEPLQESEYWSFNDSVAIYIQLALAYLLDAVIQWGNLVLSVECIDE